MAAWSTWIYFIFSLSGCLWQIGTLSHHYFQYSVSTRVELEVKDIESIPRLSLCLLLKEVFKADKDNLELKLGRKLTTRQARSLPMQLTIGQLFNYTPGPNYFWGSSSVKNSNLQSEKKKSRLGYTKVIKNGEQICYDFFIIGFVKYGRSYLENYKFWGQNVYSIVFNGMFASIRSFSIHLHSDRVSFYGRQNGGLIFYNSLPKDLRANNSFVGAYVSYRKTTSKLLQPPYATKCFDYKLPQADSAAHCLEKVFNC
ncbi:hypothetical protein HDE_09004 [Halotydeus destructor]|nr:hypothetical protein HDE_09004 [Halotydeus destructor]